MKVCVDCADGERDDIHVLGPHFSLPPSHVGMEFGEPGVYSSAGVSGRQCLFAVCYQPLHHVWYLREQDQCMSMCARMRVSMPRVLHVEQ